eukprot:333084_1
MTPAYLIVSVINLFSLKSQELSDNELNALIDIYESTNGDYWSHSKWNIFDIYDSSICELSTYNNTIHCIEYNNSFDSNSTEYTVTELIFDNNNISGSIPSTIYHLTNLETLIIRNQPLLTGSIPLEICELTYLQTLEYNSTNINQMIPSCLDQLINLNSIIFDSNYLLTGPLPINAICNLINLETFKIKYSPNLLPFIIPDCINNLKYLTHFSAVNVSLIGSIDNICNAINLNEIIIDFIYTLNTLIPICIGNLNQLKILQISSLPLLSGSLPDTICNLKNIQSLKIYTNNNEPTAKKNINYTTAFESVLPECIGDLKQLQILNISSTGFTGHIPFNICQCIDLRYIDLGRNTFTGIIPNCFGINMTNLHALHFEHNALIGNIPKSLCNAINLTELWMDHNYLDGTIADCIFDEQMYNLQLFSVSENMLHGTISKFPSHIINFALYSNSFIGDFPIIPSDVNSLRTLFIHNNSFTGTLDDIFLNNNITLTCLEYITLHENNFYADNIENLLRKIFDDAGDIIKMITFYDNLNIHGQMPEYTKSEPKYLKSLHYLNIHGCDISGSIPNNLYFNQLEFYTIHNNRISCKIPNN